MRRTCLSLLALAPLASACGGGGGGGGAVPARFVHVATLGNITDHWTEMSHPLLDGDPNAITLVTQNWNPGGGLGGIYNNHEVGVFYDSAPARWEIFNQDLAAMPVGASFNVYIPPP